MPVKDKIFPFQVCLRTGKQRSFGHICVKDMQANKKWQRLTILNQHSKSKSEVAAQRCKIFGKCFCSMAEGPMH